MENKKIIIAQGAGGPAGAGVAGAVGGIDAAAQEIQSTLGLPGRVLKSIPGGTQFLTDPNNPSENKMQSHQTETEPIEVQKESAIAALAAMGISADQTVALAGEMINEGLAEPKFVYSYLAEVATMGQTTGGASKEILTIGKYMLEKTYGNPQAAIGMMKQAFSFASEMPGLDLVGLAYDSITKGANAVPLMMMGMIAMNGEDRAKMMMSIRFLEFIQNPNRTSGNMLWMAHKALQRVNTGKQLLNLKANFALIRAMQAANTSAAPVIEGWYKRFEQNPTINKFLPWVARAYRASTLVYTLGQTSGLLGESYLKQPTGGGTTKAMNNDDKRIVLSITDPFEKIAASEWGFGIQDLPGQSAATNQPPATGVAGTAGYDPMHRYQEGTAPVQPPVVTGPYDAKQKAIQQQQQTLKDFLDAENKIITALMTQINAEAAPKDQTFGGPNIEELGGLLDPSTIEAAGKRAMSVAVWCEKENAKLKTGTEGLAIESANYIKTNSTRDQSAAQFTAWMEVAKANVFAAEAEIRGLKAKGLFTQYFGPVQRKINMLKVSLASIEQQIGAYKGNDVGSQLMQIGMYPMHQMKINIQRQMIALLFQGVTRINEAQQEQAKDKDISSMLMMLKSKIYYSIKALQVEINATMVELAYKYVGKGKGGAVNLASSYDNMTREADSPFQQGDEENEESPLFRDADKALQDYWNVLLPGDSKDDGDDIGYGDALEHPKENRHKTIKYKPRFVKRHKRIIYKEDK